jgi:Homeodomain-like domain
MGYGTGASAHSGLGARSERTAQNYLVAESSQCGFFSGTGFIALGRRDACAARRSLKKLTAKAVRVIGHRYRKGGLERALYEKQRPGAAEVLQAADKQRIIAMVCSDPPGGRARWTVRLIAEEAVKRKLVPRVGRETIRILLQSHDLKPWREKNVVYR